MSIEYNDIIAVTLAFKIDCVATKLSDLDTLIMASEDLRLSQILNIIEIKINVYI
jgi:hypothetical protein